MFSTNTKWSLASCNGRLTIPFQIDRSFYTFVTNELEIKKVIAISCEKTTHKTNN